MSEAETNPETGVDGQQSAAQDEIDTEAFDRAEAPEDDAETETAQEDGEADEGDEEGKPDGEDDESEEIEHDGQKYRVPKAVKPLLMMQQDYTRKTQEVADLRRQHEEQAKAWETERTQQAESLEELRAEHVKVGVIERQIEATKASLEQPVYQGGPALGDINWPAYRRAVMATEEGSEDRLTYERLRQAYEAATEDLDDLGRQLEGAKTTLKTKTDERLAKQREAREADIAKQRQETAAVLAKEIPGWGKERATEIVNLLSKEIGVADDELEVALLDPRIWKLANRAIVAEAEAAKARKSQQQHRTAQNHERAQQTKPAVTTGGKGGVNPRDPATPRGDGLATDEWMRRRNAQLAQKRA